MYWTNSFLVRGSIPSPGPRTVRYGGNTTCIEVCTDDGTLIIPDGGTGIFNITPLALSQSNQGRAGFDLSVDQDGSQLLSGGEWYGVLAAPASLPPLTHTETPHRLDGPGGTVPAVLSAANEIAVAACQAGRDRFPGPPAII